VSGFPDAAIAAAIALLFAAAGNAILGRRAAGIGEWNESFLVGAGAASAALVPLSIFLGHRALLAALAVVLAAAGASVLLPRKAQREHRPQVPRPRDPWTPVFFALAAAAVLLFTALDLRVAYRWDGLAIWAARAQLLHHDGSLFGTIPPPGSYLRSKLRYPPLLPLAEALVATIRGKWDFDALKPIFPLFFLSLLIGTARAARTFGSRAAALGAAALVGLLPAVSTGTNLGGYADLPEAAVVAAAAAACLRESPATLSWRSPAPWLLGALLMVKREGIIPLAVLAMVLLAAGLARPAIRPRRAWSALAPPALFLAIRAAHLLRLKIPGPKRFPLFSQPATAVAERIGLVAANAARWLLAPDLWGVLWPATFAAAAILVVRGGGKERALAAIALLCVGADAAPFLVTAWPIPLHVEQAYSRLLEQVSPLAVIVLIAARERAKEWASGGAPG